MSICTNIYCLFKDIPSAERIAEVQKVIDNRLGRDEFSRPHDKDYGHLIAENDVDTDYSFRDDGTVTLLDRPRIGPLMNEPLRQGKFFCISYLTRWWSTSYPDCPPTEYVITLLALLAQGDIEGVWYVQDDWHTAERLTTESVHGMLDAFIQVGWR